MMQFKRSHALLVIVLAAVAVYANSLWNGFAYDDLWIIAQNDRVHQLKDLRAIWLTPYWPSFGAELGLYRPFAIFAYAIEWAISGGAPWFFHLVNVLMHAGVAVLVFLLIERLFTFRAAFAGALIFAVHPVHTEAVANVVGQNELLAGLAALGACLVYINRPDGLTLSWKRLAVILVLYSLSLLAKESAVALPGLLVLLDFTQKRVTVTRAGLSTYVRALLPMAAAFAVLLTLYLILRHNVLGNLSGTDAAPGLPYLREQYRVLNGLRAWPEFVRLLFFPLDLSVDYGPAVVLPVESFTPMVALGLVFVLAVTALAFLTPRAPGAGLAAGWFLLTILPVSNFLFPIGVLIAERALYLPSIAICLLAGFAWEAIASSAEQQARRVGHIAAVAVVLLLSVRTIVRNPDWDSLQTVWHSLRRDHPESYRAQWVAAATMWQQGRFDLAEQYYQLAYRLWPRDSQMLTEWGNFYIGQRKWDKAIDLLEKSRDMTPFVPRTHTFLAWSYLHADRPDDAIRSAEQALQLEGPDKALIYLVIARAHEERGDYEHAAETWHRLLEIKRADNWLNWAMLARAQAFGGKKEEALRNAGVALSKTKGDARTAPTARQLEQSIRTDCYPRGGTCDPLKGWQTLLGGMPTALPPTVKP